MSRLFFITLVSAWLLGGCSEPVKEDQGRWVRFKEVVEEKDVLRTYSGHAKAETETHMSFRVGGRVEYVNLPVGTTIKQGDVIARLDPKHYLLKIEEAKSTLLEADAQKRRAEANFERIALLYETKSASRAELDAARTEYESGIAKMQAADSSFNLAKLQLSYTVLKAPMDSTVALKEIGVNENISAGQLVCVLDSLEKPNVVIALPEKVIDEMRVGARAEVVFNALPADLFTAYIVEVGMASPETTIFPVTLELQEKTERIRPGMTADVMFHIPLATKRLLIPPYAAFEESGRSYVYLLVKEQSCVYAKKQEVVLGDLTSDGLVVLEGVSKGDLVVTAGVHQLKEGEKVILRCD